jgi:hypothetical protein
MNISVPSWKIEHLGLDLDNMNFWKVYKVSQYFQTLKNIWYSLVWTLERKFFKALTDSQIKTAADEARFWLPLPFIPALVVDPDV